MRTASIVQFLPRGIFDDPQQNSWFEAFDTACNAMHDTGQPNVVYEVMAMRIIAAAAKGDRDVTRLRDAALTALAKQPPID